MTGGMMSHGAGKAPSSMGGQSSSGGGGYKLTRTLLAGIVLVPAVLLLLLLTQYILPQYVTKADFGRNIVGVTDTVNTAKADVDKGLASMQTKVDAIPASITAQVNTGVTQATAAMNGQITTIQTQVNNMAGVVAESKTKLTTVDALTTKVDALTAKMDALTLKQATDEALVSSLSVQVATQVATLTDNLTNQVAAQSQQIVTLSAQVLALKNSGVVSFDRPSGNITSSNTTGATVITNNSNSQVTFTLTLTLTNVPNVTAATATNVGLFPITGSIRNDSNSVVFTWVNVTINPLTSLPAINPTINLAQTSPTPPTGWLFTWGKQ